MRKEIFGLMTVALGLLLGASSVTAQQAQPAPKTTAAKSAKQKQESAVAPYEPGLQPQAVEILKAACARLAAAKSMAFTAVVSYEGPSLLGPPLIYSTKSEVTMRRPDKLKVVTLGDG